MSKAIKNNFLFFLFTDFVDPQETLKLPSKMWSSRKGPTTRLWDFIVITLVVTLNFKVSLTFVFQFWKKKKPKNE